MTKITSQTVQLSITRSSEQAQGVFKHVEYGESTTLLQALETVKAKQDGSLTFRRSCRASICGSCAMVVDGQTRLACKTRVKDLVEGSHDKNIRAVQPDEAGQVTITVAPQRHQTVVKDLMVDLGTFYDKVKKTVPFLQRGKETREDTDKASYEQVNMVSNCIMCGACYSDCVALDENPDFLGPAALAKAYRFVSDPREGHKTDRLKQLSGRNGIWDCTRCGHCVDACPKGVAPMEAILKLRTLALQAGFTNNTGARHATVFKKDIATWGVLNEPMMLLKTKGILGSLGKMGEAIHLAKKGKIPNPLPFNHKVEGLDEVKALYAELDKNPLDVRTKQKDEGPGAG